MSEEELSKINLFSLQGLEYLRESLTKIIQEIVILKDERDEYRRKWLELVNEKTTDKQIPN